uniref:ShKT domain-containing protein n=1 Tax=Caenorhabditis tropicalis TaxID=1561998 RepID=A0A1I7T5B0_9PELO
MESFRYFLVILLFLDFTEITFGQLPKCTDSGSCPTNGVWGEWKTVGSTTCDMSCGGCGTLLQERECISQPVCNCTGNTNRTIGCNFEGCKYPSQKTCCAPYLPMIINGVITCGPIPKSLDSSACCPQQSILTQWSDWSYVNSQWIRSRSCLSASIGCPCSEALTQTKTGSNWEYIEKLFVSFSGCPCDQPTDAATPCKNVALGDPIYYRPLAIDDTTCTAWLVMIAEVQGDKIYCKALKNTIYKDDYGADMNYVGALLIMQEVSGECTTDVPFDCANGATANRRQNVSFTCDMKTGKWIYDYTGKRVNAINIASWY